jgi:serine/threonine protein kinase/Tfp pilus assembly protein PilF
MIEPALLADLPESEQRRRCLADTVRQRSGEQAATDGSEHRREMPEIPGYDLLAELGRGGMGVVYLARQVSLKRLVALKMILNATPDTLARFQTEAQAVARLSHPNIVHIHEIGEHEGRPFLSLEFVEGTTLHKQIAGNTFPQRHAAQLVETLARAMHHAHQRGILHRDLKPSNVLLASADVAASLQLADSAVVAASLQLADSSSGESASCKLAATEEGKSQTCRHDTAIPKITDFGLARFLDVSAGPTGANAVIGTPSYMSPEQAAGDSSAIGVRSDVYSLGAILYHLLTGQAPFAGNTALDTLQRVREQDAVPPRRLRPGVSRDLETISLKCLKKDPAGRYRSAEDLANDLRNFLEDKPIIARAAPAWERLWRSACRRPVLVAASVGIFALICLLAVGGWYQSASTQLRARRAQQRYQEFMHWRNEALFHGLFTTEQRALFTIEDVAARWNSAETAAREALALAEPTVDSRGVTLHPAFTEERKPQIVQDCYTLFLVLAGARARHVAAMEPDRERLREALHLLDRAGELGIETRACYLRKADFLEKLDLPAEATHSRARARALKPQIAVDHFLSGEERFRQGDWDNAIGCFNEALRLEPSNFWARFFLAVAQMKKQRWESARTGLTACLAGQPDFTWAYLYRSFTHERLNCPSEAESDFAEVLRRNPSEDARYALFLTRGVLRFEQYALQPAAADFLAAIEIKPELYNAYLDLAHVYTAKNQLELASQQFAEAMRRKPPALALVAYHVERSRELCRVGRNVEAVMAAEAAQAIAPAHPQPNEMRAHALLRLSRFAEAERALGEYLRKGGDPVSDIFRARGLARMKLGRFADAVEDYTRVLEHSPDAEIFQHRGWAHFFADAWKLALRDFARAIELAPQTTDAYIGRGLAQVVIGRYQEAIEDAETALRLRPNSPAMMMNIACIFAQAMERASADADRKDRQALADGYRKSAVDALRRTLAMLPAEQQRVFWKDKILPDPALASLRQDGLAQVQQEFFPASPHPLPDSGGDSP